MPTIQAIGIKPVSFKLKNPFITAGGSKTETHNVQVTLTLSNGTQGMAEASSSIAMPSEGQVNLQRALKSLIPELHGKPIENYRELVATTWRLQSLHPTAAAAMECAILDAYTRTMNQSLANFLGGKSVVVETDLTLSIGTPAELSRHARKAAQKGFRRLKIKLTGRVPAEDVERVRAVHKAAPNAMLVADGNQGFGLSQAVDFAHRLKRAQIPLMFLEQPFRKYDLRSMRLFRQRTHMPLLADESVLTAADAVRIFEADAADGINIKVAKSGLLGALDIIHIAQRFNKRLAIGCMEESKLGLAASVHLACGTGAFEWIDLDSVFLLQSRLARGGFQMKGSKFSVKSIRAGIGM
jgi:L-alanine-DL-glutamate epimerase-like enolase superfamily enzyme